MSIKALINKILDNVKSKRFFYATTKKALETASITQSKQIIEKKRFFTKKINVPVDEIACILCFLKYLMTIYID